MTTFRLGTMEQRRTDTNHVLFTARPQKTRWHNCK